MSERFILYRIMAFLFPHIMNLDLQDRYNRAIARQTLRRNQKYLRDRSNPFDLPDQLFLKLFRLDKTTVRDICQQLNPFLPQGRRATYIPNHLKVLLTLHFLGQGSYQAAVGAIYNFAVSQPTASRIIEQITQSMYHHIVPEKIKFPSTEEEINNIKQHFIEKYNFPGVVGCIDCTHIAIVNPPAENEEYRGELYYNRKGYASINTQIICDSELKILSINARYPGSTHDAAIWQTSRINDLLRQKYFEGLKNTWLLGDSGYPLLPWLLTPIINPLEGSPDYNYTRAHISARNTIERLNGVLKARFRCLLKHRTLHYSPSKTSKIITTCAALHNICIERKIQNNEHILEYEIENEDNDLPHQDNLLPMAQRIRNNLILQHFT